LTPGEIAGAADSTELVFINSVDRVGMLIQYLDAIRADCFKEHGYYVVRPHTVEFWLDRSQELARELLRDLT
jgi:hypothetical protein